MGRAGHSKKKKLSVEKMSGGELALVDLYGLVSIVVEMYSMIAGRSASELIAGHLLPLPGTCLPPPRKPVLRTSADPTEPKHQH